MNRRLAPGTGSGNGESGERRLERQSGECYAKIRQGMSKYERIEDKQKRKKKESVSKDELLLDLGRKEALRRGKFL